jgi:N-acetylglucosaminyl-diphospho-decaprenol L-rhamnosyltransferase
MTVPTVSLVTVTYNNAAELEHFWKKWPTGAAEWLVVDNASSDGSSDLARRLGARLVQLPENVGFSAANNMGARLATGSVLGFVNPDLTVTPEGLDALARRVVDQGAIVAPQLVNLDGSLQENGRATPYPARKLAHMFAPRSRTNLRYVRHVEQGLERVVWAMGAALFMSSEVFDRIGGWDEGYFIYYEDSDICLRALEAQVPTFIDGDVRWVHGWARETKSGRSLAVWKREFRSAARFYRRHPECIAPVGAHGMRLRRAEQTMQK